jgi:hypothetical protein
MIISRAYGYKTFKGSDGAAPSQTTRLTLTGDIIKLDQ